MKRDVYRQLRAWKASQRRKPLMLRGVRQVGKTWILREFAKNEYENTAYFNFEADPALDDFFAGPKDPHKIIANLALYQKTKILPGSTLLIFDEIQQSNHALNALKYFTESAPDFHVAAAGSLLGVKTSKPGGFPVGKVNFMDLFPLTFLEFLDAAGESGLRTLIEKTNAFRPYPEGLHRQLIDLLRIYYFVGGMPEAVDTYARRKDLEEVRQVQREIIDSYVLDFAKHAPGAEIPKLTAVWESIPSHLGRVNKKFMFSALKKSARAREYEGAIQWLEDAGLILRSFLVRDCKSPLKAYRERGIFKVYAPDVGLLGALARTPADMVVRGERIFREYEGAFVENYVGSQIFARSGGELYYWTSSGTAEVDFVCESGNQIHPLEVKAGVNARSKSLKSYDEKYHPPVLSRATLLNLKHDGKIRNFPLYAIALFPFPVT